MIEWNVDPEIVRVGPAAIRWYGLFFISGFFIGERYVSVVISKLGFTKKEISSLLTYLLVGTIVGARIGHCFFYEPDYYLLHPLEVIEVWRGGLASHGGYIGILLAMFFYVRKVKKISFFGLTDIVAGPALLAGSLIRLGNLFNSEVFGRPSEVPWAFVFKRVDSVPRHPTQIYEALAYLIIAAILFYSYKNYKSKWIVGRVTAVSMFLSPMGRIVVEFFKENQVPFENGMALNMGQLLSIPAMILGLYLFFANHNDQRLFAIFHKKWK